MSTPNIVGGSVSADMRQAYSAKHVDLFRLLGHSDVEPLGRGMEATTYSLAGELVGKVWESRSAENVASLKAFYDELVSCDLPFATPAISDVREMNGVVVSVERRLPGRPFSHDPRSTQEVGMNKLVDVLESMSEVELRTTSNLTVIHGEPTPWTQDVSFEAGLALLMDRKIELFGDQLCRSVERFDDKVIAIKKLLHNSVATEVGLIHGDLGGENLLVDDDFNVASVLDFGFLSTVGNSRFDATIASGVLDMWSPRSQLRQHQFDALLERRLGYSPVELLVLRAAYSVIVANAYDAEGQDGQFWWSSTFLNRPDVHELLAH